jgi:class 3 adenylate cyclase/tetratricopeptide (TPR) repeat protein
MRFCGECGAQLDVVCASCGAPNSPGDKFCGQCGAPCASLPASVPMTPAAPAGVREPGAPYGSPPREYTPRHLAEHILMSKGALEGERKNVTVLFVDIADSSRLAEQLDPEAMHELMEHVLRLMAQMVHRYNGTVNQFLGDGLMALFGAPLALEDHALRAVHAALGIRETVDGYSEQLKRARGVELRLRLGLNTGPVIVGKIGDDLRMDYTAIGDTTHLASRMQTLAEPGTIMITEPTHRLVAGYVVTEPLGKVQVKGRSMLVEAFRVTERRRRRSRLEVSAQAGLTELIGREPEQATLHDCLARAISGRGQVVGLVGEAGLGKSRLVYEFQKSVVSGRVAWLEAQCAADAQATPYAPILQILGAVFQIEEGDNPPQIEEKLRRGLRQLDPALEPALPFLREPFGLPGEDDALRHLSAREKRQKTFESIVACTVAESQRRPLVIVVEDLHWIDRTSEEYLTLLVDTLPGTPILLVTTSRPGYTVRWAQKTYYTQVALGQFDAREVDVMVATLLGADDVPDDFGRRIHEKAEGNPLFVEEITKSLRERGLLASADGKFTWPRNAVVDLPPNVHDVVSASLDRLDEPVKRTAQAAATIGRRFGLRVLSRVSATPREIDGHLAALKQLELVHEARTFPDPEYMFRHALIQDAAYESLLGPRRRALHGAIGRALEELYADRLDEQAAILAYHYARGDEPERAIGCASTAGDRAARVCANAEAATHYRQALDLSRALPPSPEARRREIDAVLKLVTVSATREDIQRDRDNVQAARAVAEQLNDDGRLARLLYWAGRIEYVLGNTPSAIDYAEQSLKTADKDADDALSAPPLNLLGRLYWQQGALPDAVTALERSTEQMLRLGNLVDAATTAGFAGIAHADAGDFTRAIARADQGVRIADEIGNPFARAAARYFRGHVRSNRGEWAGALEDFEEGRRIAETVGDRFRVYTIMVYEGRAWLMRGDPPRARLILEECIAIAEQIGTKLFLSRPKAFLAECLLTLGEGDRAEIIAEEGLRLAEETGERHGSALARRALAQACLRGNPSDPQRANEMIRAAIEIQRENGEQPELARSHVVWADVLATQGDYDGARQVLSNAIDMFRAMGMAWDVERAQQLLL